MQSDAMSQHESHGKADKMKKKKGKATSSDMESANTPN